MFVRAYLRASTDDQDANRARDQLQAFAAERGLTIAAWYVENESGAIGGPPTWADLSASGIERRPPLDELALGQRIVSWAGALIVRRRLMGRLFVGLTVFSAIFLFAATLLFVLLLPV
jgi:hypothetical protein